MGAENEFLTGVVEGFYGRPWTYPQRRELFRRMNQMGMNSYLYAPKDDIKHRQSWRELYTAEEEQQLQYLIKESTEAGVLFIFALSPGLDATFSSAKEVETLKGKIDQVSKLGCTAFALLFDDIELRLCPADREVFSSSARAQVVFANEIYNYLGCPKVFLFCPTEYSASLAVPSISKSEYLSTIASCLAPGIAVIWTGPLVISKTISAKQLRQLSKLLKHPIVLWDNLHANDYDQRRVFIGPYSGRALTLRRRGLIRGVLTNPNCEFEANYVALHTLAQWSRYGGLKVTASGGSTHEQGQPINEHVYLASTDEECCDEDTDNDDTEDDSSDEEGENNQQPTTVEMADAQTGDDFIKIKDSVDPGGSHASGKKNVSLTGCLNYRPRKALLVALRDWLALMLEDQQMCHAPQGAVAPTTSLKTSAGVTPTPMDTDVSEGTNLPDTGSAPAFQEAEMQVDPSAGPPPVSARGIGDSASDISVSVDVTLSDLELFADLFYLPFAHGPAGLRLLELGHWLREHSYACGLDSADPEKSSEWLTKLTDFTDLVASVGRLRDRIQRLPSRSIAYELAPYVTEVHTVLGMVMDYFNWLETGVMATRTMCHLRRLLTWFSPGYRDMVTSGDQEPWTFRGGLITELQRILPLESAQDLFPAPSRALPSTTITGVPPTGVWSETGPALSMPSGMLTPQLNIPGRYYIVRPYRAEDKPALYALFRRLLLARLGMPENALPPELIDLPGDRYLSHFLEHSPENCLVVEGPPFRCAAVTPSVAMEASDATVSGSLHDPQGQLPSGAPGDQNPPSANTQFCIVGFGLAAANAVIWARDRTVRYREVFKYKYPRDTQQRQPSDDPGILPMSADSTTLGSDLPVAEDSSASGMIMKPPFSAHELVKFLLHPFHMETPEVSDLAEAASVFPPPEPLGASLPAEPMLSGCLEVTASEHTSSPMPTSVNLPPPPLLPDTAPPSPPTGGRGDLIGDSTLPKPAILPTTSFPPRPVSAGVPVSTGGGVGYGLEALHSALTAHPATLLVELDDLGLVPVTPNMLVNHSLGVDVPEVLLDSVVRRLFVCLLAALKTVGAHGAHVQLDAVNEHRAELYRRFGFYHIPAASSDQTTVLARLI